MQQCRLPSFVQYFLVTVSANVSVLMFWSLRSVVQFAACASRPVSTFKTVQVASPAPQQHGLGRVPNMGRWPEFAAACYWLRVGLSGLCLGLLAAQYEKTSACCARSPAWVLFPLCVFLARLIYQMLGKVWAS